MVKVFFSIFIVQEGWRVESFGFWVLGFRVKNFESLINGTGLRV
jgi:hypothetical protein